MKGHSSPSFWALFLRGRRLPPYLAPLVAFLALLPFLFLPATPSEAFPRPHLGYGANIAALGDVTILNDMGFGWFVHYLDWASAEPNKGGYDWANLDNIIEAAESSGLKAILRVALTPDWAWSGGGDTTGPPDNMDDFGDFMEALATYAQGKVAGYVIWNEPNLPYEWGWNDPSPAQYVEMLQAVYPRIKAADPDAVVITAGMATTGGGGGAACGVGTGIALQKVSPFTQNLYAAGVMPDLDFICGIYLSGGQGYFDVLGSHPYGFAAAFDELPSTGLAFRRVEQQRAVMEAMGDSAKQVWAIEFGWVLYPGESCHYTHDWESRWWQIVSETEQATNLAGAYEYAYQTWSWMGVMNFFNLDFATVPWYDYCQPMRWYSVVYRDTPGVDPLKYWEAYYALRDMPKYTSGSLSGYVRDNRGIPFSGARVEILSDGDTNSGGGGRYEFPLLPSGTYDLQATASGYGALEPMRDVVMNEGEALTDVNFYLPPPDNVVSNWDFESDLAQWPIGGANTPTISASAHTGYKSAQLGGAAAGDSWVQQTVEIPADMYRPTLSFLYRYPSQDTGEVAQVTVAGIIESISVSSEWTHHWIDLDELQGETVTIRFTVSENGSNPSYLYLDEVSLGKASGGPYKGYFPFIYKGS